MKPDISQMRPDKGKSLVHDRKHGREKVEAPKPERPNGKPGKPMGGDKGCY